VLPTGYDPVSAPYQSAVLPLNEESRVLRDEWPQCFKNDWCWQPGSNRRPPHYEGGALPTELCQHEKRQTDGAPASHLRRAAVARTPSNFWTLTMSNSTAIAGQFQTQSRIRARIKRERQQMSGRRIGTRICARTRREQRKTHIGREFARVLNVVWAIGP